ncbi:MAG: GNAT family N-acetyltransferase, partial [Rhodoferax sp.]
LIHSRKIMIEYRHNFPLDPKDVVRVFDSSGITRPTKDLPRIARMFAESNLVISAWAESELVGVCRALTDYSYCCYLSDLAIAQDFQRHGIGSHLIQQVREAIGEEVSLILVSNPNAVSYYPTVGFTKAETGYIIKRVR